MGGCCGAVEAVAVTSPYTGIIFSLVCHTNLCRAGAGTVAGAGRVHRHRPTGGVHRHRPTGGGVRGLLGLATGNQQEREEKVS